MSKPRNKTNRRRLHYLGVLAAAGLLTMGAAAPAMALDATAGTNSIGSGGGLEVDPTNGIKVIGGPGNVSWTDVAITTGGLNFDSASTNSVTVTNGTDSGTITAGGITVSNTGAGTFAVGNNSASVGGNLAGTGAALNITVGDGTFTQTATDLVTGTVNVTVTTSSGTSANSVGVASGAGTTLTLTNTGAGNATLKAAGVTNGAKIVLNSDTGAGNMTGDGNVVIKNGALDATIDDISGTGNIILGDGTTGAHGVTVTGTISGSVQVGGANADEDAQVSTSQDLADNANITIVNQATGASSFTQTSGTIGTAAGDVVTVTNAAGNAAGKASLGTMYDGATLAVGNAVDITGLATGGVSNIKGTTSVAADNTVALNQGKLNLHATDQTTLNFGGAANEKVTINYSGNLNTTGTGGFKVGAAGTDGLLATDSKFVMAAGTKVVGDKIEVGNGADMGTLRNATVAITKDSTTSTLRGTDVDTNNTITGTSGSTAADTKTIIDDVINGGTTTANNLYIGDGVDGVKVEATDNIVAGTTSGLNIEVRAGSAFEQTVAGAGEVSGNVFAKNNNAGAANADKLVLNILDGANVAITGDIKINSVTASTNSISGGGTAHMDVAGFGNTANLFKIKDGTLAISGDGDASNTTITLNSTDGDSVLDATGAGTTTGVTVKTVQVDTWGPNNLIIKSDADSKLQITDAFAYAGSPGAGHLVFESAAGSTTGGTFLNGGIDIQAGGVGIVDHIGDNTIDTTGANPNAMDVATVNVVNGKFTTIGGDAIVLNDATEVNLAGNTVFNFGAGNSGFKSTTGDAIDTLNIGGSTTLYDGTVLAAGTETAPSSVSLADGALVAGDVNVLGYTIFDTNVSIVNDYTALAASSPSNGIFVDVSEANQVEKGLLVGNTMALTAGSQFVVENGASSAADTTIHFTGVAGAYSNVSSTAYGTAIVVDTAADAKIDGIAYFDVPDIGTNPDAIFQVIDSADGSNMSNVWNSFEYSGAGYGGWASTGAAYYNKGNGVFSSLSKAKVQSALDHTPRYGKEYVEALMYYNTALADAIGNGYFNGGNSSLAPYVDGNTAIGHRVLSSAMGHTLNAVHMVTNNSLLPIMNNLNTLHPQTENRIASSSGDCETFGLWITPNFSYRSIDGDYAGGYGGDVDIKNYGVTLGFDGWINEQFRLGLFASFNSGELDADYEDIDSDDIQIGVYGQAVLPAGFMLNAGFAYGWQDYDASRQVQTGVTGYDQKIKSSFDGNTITAALELNKVFSLDYNMFLRPSISYTYMGVELDSYREKSNNLVNNLSQKVDETDYDVHLIRVGTDIGWSVENAAIIGRLYYVGNAGDTDVKTRAHLISTPQQRFTVRGVEYDDSMANLGLTLKIAPSDNSHFAIDYDALLGSNSASHNVNLTFKYEW